MAQPPTKYSVELPGSRKPGQTGIYRNALSPDNLTVTIRFIFYLPFLFETF
jgi:hypothetical protein